MFVENEEVLEVKKKKMPMITDSEMRGVLSNLKKTIAVTGVHGKTTTSALIAFLFDRAGLKPSFLVGTGTVPDLAAPPPGCRFAPRCPFVTSRCDTTPPLAEGPHQVACWNAPLDAAA